MTIDDYKEDTEAQQICFETKLKGIMSNDLIQPLSRKYRRTAHLLLSDAAPYQPSVKIRRAWWKLTIAFLLTFIRR